MNGDVCKERARSPLKCTGSAVSYLVVVFVGLRLHTGDPAAYGCLGHTIRLFTEFRLHTGLPTAYSDPTAY